jgi:hypothetical protein
MIGRALSSDRIVPTSRPRTRWVGRPTASKVTSMVRLTRVLMPIMMDLITEVWAMGYQGPPTEPVLVTVGDIACTQRSVFTPSSPYPLAGATWIVAKQHRDH